MTASTLARFRCSLSGVQATDCVKVNYTVARRRSQRLSLYAGELQFFDIPRGSGKLRCAAV